MYYIVSLKHTQKSHRFVTFWRAERSGYAWPLSWAGKYSDEEVRSTPHLNDGVDTLAIPCEVVDVMAVPTPPKAIDDDAGPVVLNTGKNMRELMKYCARTVTVEGAK